MESIKIINFFLKFSSSNDLKKLQMLIWVSSLYKLKLLKIAWMLWTDISWTSFYYTYKIFTMWFIEAILQSGSYA